MNNLDRVIGFDTQFLIQVALQFFNTFVCFLILYYLLYKPVKKFMAGRSEQIEDKIKQAERRLHEANDLKNQYELLLKQADDEGKKLLEIKKKEAKLLLDAAKAEIHEMKKRARVEIELDKVRAQDNMKKEIFDVSWTVINYFLENNIDAKLHDELNQKYIKEMQDMDLENKLKKAD